MSGAGNPCQGCADRNSECHGICEKYLSWQKNHITEMHNIGLARREENELYAVHRESIKRCITTKKRKKGIKPK